MRALPHLLFAVGLWAAGCAETPVPADAGDLRDVGLDGGGVGVDAGAVVCTGTATACATRKLSTCSGGCVSRSCGGDPRPCAGFFTDRECRAAGGCSWSSRGCEGATYPCDSHGDESACRAAGCTVLATAVCTGSATPCSALGRAACATSRGCSSIDDDGGASTDAGAADAPAPTTADAPLPTADATDPGACTPLPPAGCDPGETCMPSDDFSSCVAAGSRLPHEPCGAVGLCVAGAVCIERPATGVSECLALCASSADCSGAEPCTPVPGLGGYGVCAG